MEIIRHTGVFNFLFLKFSVFKQLKKYSEGNRKQTPD